METTEILQVRGLTIILSLSTTLINLFVMVTEATQAAQEPGSSVGGLSSESSGHEVPAGVRCVGD